MKEKTISHKIKMIVFLILIMTMTCIIYIYNQKVVALSNDNDDNDIENSTEQIIDLSVFCERTVYEDETGYNKQIDNQEELPFDYFMSNLYIKAKEDESIELREKDKNELPTLLIKNASDFELLINYVNKKEGDSLYEYKSETSNPVDKVLSKKYTINFDEWGAKQQGNRKEEVWVNNLALLTGEIGTGAIVIQTKEEYNDEWKNLDKEKYANGLYTTNVLNNYGGTQVPYLLSGDSIKKGIFVSISFLYEVKYVCEKKGLLNDKTTYYNIRETYTFYVVEDNPAAITFNNLTESTSIDKKEFDDSENTQQDYITSIIEKISQTMGDGAITTTGFKINITANPYAQVIIKRNGVKYQKPTLIETEDEIYYLIKENGKYEITVTTYDSSITTIIYVDKDDSNEVYERYFGSPVEFNNQYYGDYFLDYSPNNIHGNKRCYDEYSTVPVFLSTVTMTFKTPRDIYMPTIQGVLINKSTGNIEKIENKKFTIENSGIYEVIFYNNPQYYEKIILKNNQVELTGDVRIYKFNFKVVENYENKTINESLLSTNEFNDSYVISPSDYFPKYYGVTRHSANKGRIIVAFASREAALDYAYQVAWGEVETHKDSKGNTYWLIPNIDNLNGLKIRSDSGWNNARKIKELAESMVEECYFDLTMTSSFMTIDSSLEDIEFTDLQMEDITKSVIIWYNFEQRNKALISHHKEDIVIKYISKQESIYLSKNENGQYSKINSLRSDFKFVSDYLHIDSYKITATDLLGNVINIDYNDSLYNQLKNNNCFSGIYEIVERNIYNDITAQYYIYYIEEGYQPAQMNCIIDSNFVKINSSTLNMYNYGTFKRFIIENITNFEEPYSFVKIKNNGVNRYYDIKDINYMIIDEPGLYELSIIDRFGNSLDYIFTISK